MWPLSSREGGGRGETLVAGLLKNLLYFLRLSLDAFKILHGKIISSLPYFMLVQRVVTPPSPGNKILKMEGMRMREQWSRREKKTTLCPIRFYYSSALFPLFPSPLYSPSLPHCLSFRIASSLPRNLPPCPHLCSLSPFPQSFTFNPQYLSLPSTVVFRGGLKGHCPLSDFYWQMPPPP